MANNTDISNAAAKAACDAVVDLLDAHATLPGHLDVYDDVQPASVDAGPGVKTLLAVCTLNDPAFGAAADATPGGQATMDATPAPADTSADASGTADWFRGEDGSDVGVVHGSAWSTGTVDMTLDNAVINAGQTVTITSWTVTMGEG